MRHRLVPVALIVGVAAVASWHSLSTGSSPARNKPYVSFSCCRAADVDRIYHPGDTVRVHWLVDFEPDGSTGEAAPITLSARIVGNFASVRQMKHHPRLSARGAGSPLIHVTEQSFARHPISEIQLPANARPGVYSLVTTVHDGGVLTGAGSITVAAR